MCMYSYKFSNISFHMYICTFTGVCVCTHTTFLTLVFLCIYVHVQVHVYVYTTIFLVSGSYQIPILLPAVKVSGVRMLLA
jgi:hypothetical protein